MPNINAFRPKIHEKDIFKGFNYIYTYIKLCHLRAWPFVTPETLFEQVSLSKGCSMPDTKAFRPVVHEKKTFKCF